MTDSGNSRIAGRTAVISGAASGLGEAIARRFVSEGARCLLTDIRREAVEAVARDLGGDTTAMRVDVTREDEVADSVAAASERYGGIDILVNNAGQIGAAGPIARTQVEDWHRTLDVLLTSVFLGIKHAAGPMAAAGRGSIINLTSVAGLVGGLGPHAYTAAKHGVVGLTRSAASELSHFGVRVNCIAPGSIVTPMTAEAGAGDVSDIEGARERIGQNSLLPGRAGVPEDIAAAALYLASDEAGYVNGHCLSVDAGSAVIPRRHGWVDRSGYFGGLAAGQGETGHTVGGR